MVNKNAFLIKNILLLSIKFIIFMYFFSLIIFFVLDIILNPNKLLLNPNKFNRLLVNEIISIIPFLFLLFISLICFLLIMSIFEKVEILEDSSKVNLPIPIKIWNVQENTCVSTENFNLVTYPAVKMNFLLPYNTKKISIISLIPFEMNKFYHQTSLIGRFLNTKRLLIPFEAKKDEIIVIPNGGLLNKETFIPGLLILQMKPLTRLQTFYFKLFQFVAGLAPCILFLLIFEYLVI